jgi:hypothetical protein
MGKYSYFYIDFCINLFFSNVVLMFKFISCLDNYGVVLLLGFVSLMWWSTTGVPMSPWYGANQTATPYTTYATTSSCTEVFQYYTTKASETYPQLTPPRATTLTPWSITLPRVTTPPRRPITTWLRMLPGFTTPPRRRSTTWWRMLPILLHRGS